MKTEFWDLLDAEGKTIGYKMKRGEKQPPNTWHCVIGVIIQRNDGCILLAKRAKEKEQFPNKWEHVGGCVITREKPETTAVREVKEELGIEISPHELQLADTFFEKTAYVKTYLLKKEVEISTCVLQKTEVSQIKWANLSEIKEMMKAGTFSEAAWKRLERVVPI